MFLCYVGLFRNLDMAAPLSREERRNRAIKKQLVEQKRCIEKAQACLPKGSSMIGIELISRESGYNLKPKKFIKVDYRYQGKEFYTFILAQGWR